MSYETLKSGLGKTALVLAVAGGALLGVKKCSDDMELKQEIEENRMALSEARMGAASYATVNYIPTKGHVEEAIQCEATDKKLVYQCQAVSEQCKTEIECTLNKIADPDYWGISAGEGRYHKECTTTKIEGPTVDCSITPEAKRNMRHATINLGIKVLNAIDDIGAPGKTSENTDSKSK